MLCDMHLCVFDVRLSFENRVLLSTYLIGWRKYALKNLRNYIASCVSLIYKEFEVRVFPLNVAGPL